MNDSQIIGAFKHMQVPLMIVGATGQIMHCNAVADRLFGYDVGGLRGCLVSDVLSVKSVEDLNAIIKPPAIDAIVKGMTGRCRNGTRIPLGIHMTAWTDAEFGLQHALVLRDTTQEVQAAKRARDELERAQSAIKGAGIAIFEYNCATETVSICDIWRDILELAPAETVDLKSEWASRLHPADQNIALETFRLCRHGTRSKASCDYRLRSRDGTKWRWIRSDFAVTERDKAGNVMRVNGAMTDITERKSIDEALRQSVEQFRSSFETAVVGMCLVGPDGRFLQVNPALCDLLEYPEEELLKLDFQSVTHPDDLAQDVALVNRLKAGEIPHFRFEKRYIRASGTVMWGALNVGLVRDDEGRPHHFVSQIVDVTEQRQLAELKSEFVATVSHELRTPLTSVLGSLSLLSLMDAEPLSDEAQRLLFIAEQNGNRMHALINDVLDFEKFSAKRMQFNLSQSHIVRLVEEAILANLASADKYNVRFSVECSNREATGFTDPARFQQVMTNLISNAAKFAISGSQIVINVEEQQKAVRISVTNQGEGIPSSFREQLFKPFSQAGTGSTRKTGGTGLGLSITKQIVEQTGGEIGFDSRKDGQATFWFTVPKTLTEDAR